MIADEMRAKIERRRKLRIAGASQEEVDADWHGVPFPPPPRNPPRQINWPAWGCVLAAVAVWWLVYAIIWTGERMVDAVLAIQWPI